MKHVFKLWRRLQSVTWLVPSFFLRPSQYIRLLQAITAVCRMHTWSQSQLSLERLLGRIVLVPHLGPVVPLVVVLRVHLIRCRVNSVAVAVWTVVLLLIALLLILQLVLVGQLVVIVCHLVDLERLERIWLAHKLIHRSLSRSHALLIEIWLGLCSLPLRLLVDVVILILNVNRSRRERVRMGIAIGTLAHVLRRVELVVPVVFLELLAVLRVQARRLVEMKLFTWVSRHRLGVLQYKLVSLF